MLRASLVLCVLFTACSSQAPSLRGRTEHPIVLIHGLSGFSSVGGVEYFYEVPQTLKNDGFDVHVTTTPPWAPVSVRASVLAKQLREILQKTRAEKLHLIAHSMGGLDAREAIHDAQLAPHVATLTTIGTPHRGTEVADAWFNARLSVMDLPRNAAANLYAAFVGSPPGYNDSAASVWSLTTEEAKEFNQKYPDDPKVKYFSFAGRTLGHDGRGFCEDALLPNPDAIDVPPPNLVGSALLLSGLDRDHPVANDGLVTVPSAKWGTFVGCLPANHMKMVGHPIAKDPVVKGWDHLPFYLKLARWLAGRADS